MKIDLGTRSYQWEELCILSKLWLIVTLTPLLIAIFAAILVLIPYVLLIIIPIGVVEAFNRRI